MLARFITRSTMARMPARQAPVWLACQRSILPSTFRFFSSSPQQQQQQQTPAPTKPAGPPFQYAGDAGARAFMNFLDEDHEGAAWGHYASAVVKTRAKNRDAEHKRKLAFLALAFREFDIDRDHVLSKDELKLALISMKLPYEFPEVKAMMAELDKNKDKVIQLDEWLDHLPESVTKQLEEHASAASWHKLAWGE